jgi:glycerol kinase
MVLRRSDAEPVTVPSITGIGANYRRVTLPGIQLNLKPTHVTKALYTGQRFDSRMTAHVQSSVIKMQFYQTLT